MFFAKHLLVHYSCPERAEIVVFENTMVKKQTICRTMRYHLFYAPDNASLIVRLTLEELQQPYETQLVDRAVGGQKHHDYLQHNPVGRIPTLLINDVPVFETAAILLHLAERHNAMAPIKPEEKEEVKDELWGALFIDALHTQAMKEADGSKDFPAPPPPGPAAFWRRGCSS